MPGRSTIGLIPEAVQALRRRALHPVRVWWRRSWIYRRLLMGTLADRIGFVPYDPLTRRLEDAETLLRGRFNFAGQTVEVKEGSIFDKSAPSPAWAEALHGFAWLPPLSAAGGNPARILATNLISQWLKRNARYSEPAWLPHIIARRLVNLFSHGRLAFANADIMWRSKVFVGLREQSRMLSRIVREAPSGLPRLEAAAALALTGTCLEKNEARLNLGLKQFEEEVASQVLPDGGHVSRSPESLVHAYRHVTMVLDALVATGHEIPQRLRIAHDRMTPMIRFFRHGDGSLALFNGGNECDPKMLAALLARDEVRGQPFAHARHSGYHRLASSRTLVVMDCGTLPPLEYAGSAHAGCLSFEMSCGQQRIVVNCGSASVRHTKWDGVVGATAAHSTLTLADTSSAVALKPGFIRDLVGPRMIAGPTKVEAQRHDTSSGSRVEASHDAYLSQYGIMHERQITLFQQGSTLTGADRLVPVHQDKGAHNSIPFAVRFHIHPDVRISQSQGGDILLKLPSGEGWRFRAGGAQVATEESVYLGGDTVRRTEQIVLMGAVKDQAVEVGWLFEQITSREPGDLGP
jgi:uncharacterized heparinase superfamily protein